MRNRWAWLVLGLVLPAAPGLAEAIWRPLWDVIPRADVAVVARLEDVREWTEGTTDFGQGDLIVESVLFGAQAAPARLHLEWSNESTKACPRVEHGMRARVPALWLLRRHGSASAGVVRADDDAVVSLEDGKAVAAHLRMMREAPEATQRDVRHRAVLELLASKAQERR